MKATEFVKSMGIGAVKGFIKNRNIRNLETELELKRLVKSHELVEAYGGLDRAKDFVENFRSDRLSLKMAIADVEACQ